jgi:hypothetical protein
MPPLNTTNVEPATRDRSLIGPRLEALTSFAVGAAY